MISKKKYIYEAFYEGNSFDIEKGRPHSIVIEHDDIYGYVITLKESGRRFAYSSPFYIRREWRGIKKIPL